MKNIQDFIKGYNGKWASYPTGFYRGECVSLVKRWLQFNGWPMRAGNAIKWQFNGYGGYHFWYNTPSLVPKVGDIVVFATGPFGHVGIVVSATAQSMQVFNQNYPLKSPAHLTTFDYIKPHCVGFLRKA